MRVEVHLLSGGRDLYGVSMALELVGRIREERKFKDSNALKEQICLDIKQALEILT